jgi:hypothetical protein
MENKFASQDKKSLKEEAIQVDFSLKLRNKLPVKMFYSTGLSSNLRLPHSSMVSCDAILPHTKRFIRTFSKIKLRQTV